MAFMAELIGNWNEIDLAGHICRVFEPAQPSPHRFVVVYLHCSGSAPIGRYPAFVDEFERHGLRVIEPVSGLSWWTDRIWPEFDPQISAEAYVMKHVVPHVAERWAPARRNSPCWASAWVARRRCAWPTSIPTCSRPWPPSRRPSISRNALTKASTRAWSRCTATPKTPARTLPCYTSIRSIGRGTSSSAVRRRDERWHDSAERLRMKLSSLGVPFECDLETDNGGHSYQYFCHMAERSVGFLAERLEKERRRIV